MDFQAIAAVNSIRGDKTLDDLHNLEDRESFAQT